MVPPAACLALALALLGTHQALAFRVCLISPAQDFTACDASTDPRTWVGYEVDNFRWISEKLRWTEGTEDAMGDAPPDSGNWSFSCQPADWGGMMQRLVNDSQYEECAMALGEITITSARIESGVRFASSNYRGGVGILMRNEATTQFSAWGFLRPFNWTLWLAFLLTLMALPFVLWFVEAIHAQGRIVFSAQTLWDLQEAVYHTGLTCFNLNTFQATKLPAQVVLLTFCCLNLVVITNYLANLVAGLSLVSVRQRYSDVSLLRGKAVATHNIYVAGLEALYSIANVRVIQWLGSPTFLEVSAQLRSGQLTAYMVDYVSLNSLLMLHNPGCELMLMKGQILPVDYGWAYHRLFPDDVIEAVDLQMKAALEAGLLHTLEERYITFNDKCSILANAGSASSISFTQLRGLWIILGSVIVFVALWSCSTILKHVGRHMTYLRSQEPDSPRGTPSRQHPPSPLALRKRGSLSASFRSLNPSTSRSRRTARMVRKAFGRVFIRSPPRASAATAAAAPAASARSGSSSRGRGGSGGGGDSGSASRKGDIPWSSNTCFDGDGMHVLYSAQHDRSAHGGIEQLRGGPASPGSRRSSTTSSASMGGMYGTRHGSARYARASLNGRVGHGISEDNGRGGGGDGGGGDSSSSAGGGSGGGVRRSLRHNSTGDALAALVGITPQPLAATLPLPTSRSDPLLLDDGSGGIHPQGQPLGVGANVHGGGRASTCVKVQGGGGGDPEVLGQPIAAATPPLGGDGGGIVRGGDTES